jgi:ketosteroid isomerase-like protein
VNAHAADTGRTPAELVNALLVAMADYDADALAPLLHDDIVWWSPASASRKGAPRPINGRDDVVRIFCGGLGLYRAGTITWQVDQLIVDTSDPTVTRVAAVFSRRSLTAAGHPYENQYCFVLLVRDGRVAEGWEFVDTAHAFDQIDKR